MNKQTYPDEHSSKTDWECWLRATNGWWQDPMWGVRRGKEFRRWAVSQWRAAKGRKERRWGHNPARHYNLTLKAARLRPAREIAE